MSDAMCVKYGCDYQVDLDGQVTCSNCGAMDDDMHSIIESLKSDPYTQEVLEKLGSDYDENGIPYWENGAGGQEK
jgi:hypothetical protein